jgi:hypothetical protein
MSAGARQWVARLALTFLVWFGVCAVASLFGAHPSYGLVALVVAAVAAVLLLFLDTSGSVDTTSWRLPDTDPVRPPGEDPRLSLLRRAVDGHLVAREVSGQLHRHLMAVLDQRLVSRYGVSLRADPERATDLMGPELARFAAATDPYPRLSVEQIDVLIDRIEAL